MNLFKKLTFGLTAAAVTAVPVLAVSSTAFAGTTPPSPTTCATTFDDAWPANVDGQPPSFQAGAPGGVYLWHDSTGWHLRVTHENSRLQTYRGVITIPRGKIRFDRVLDERNDKTHLSRNGKTLTFKFKNYGKVDGIDFRTLCAPSVAFGFTVNGHRLPTSKIVIGASEWHPAHNPFRIVR
jgi:hypothetical protein